MVNEARGTATRSLPLRRVNSVMMEGALSTWVPPIAGTSGLETAVLLEALAIALERVAAGVE